MKLTMRVKMAPSKKECNSGMRTTVTATGTLALILSVGNVMLLLQRAKVETESPGMLRRTTSRSVPSYGQPRPASSAKEVGSIWPRLGYGSTQSSNETPAALEPGLSRCPSARRPPDDQVVWVKSVWQLQYVGLERIYVYSAYYDDRPAAGSLPSVRVLALSTFRRNISITCALWYDGVDRPYVVPATVNFDAGSGYGFDRQTHREYAYICPLPTSQPVPTHISMLGGPGTCPGPGGYTTLVAIQRTPAADHQPVEFGVCVTAGYGYVEPEVMVEWVELNRMYGASEINLYDVCYSDNMSTVFDYYRALGVLTVHALPHPRADHPSWFFNKVRNLRIIALNDCQLKYMYRYRYIIVIDTDEVIVPRTTANYSSLMKKLDMQRNNGGVAGFTYVFLNIYFLLDFEQDTSKPYYLRTMRYRHRVRPKSWGYAPKSIVDPRQCSVFFNHFCARYLTPPTGRTHHVPFDTATSHHYRKCGRFYAYTCDQLFAEKTRDDVMLHVERPLNARVQPVLRQLAVLP